MKNTRELSIQYLRFMKDRYWRDFQRVKSILESTLSNLSTKSEEELTKHDLLALISCNCDYMHALNLYNYFKDTLTSELVAKNEQAEQ